MLLTAILLKLLNFCLSFSFIPLPLFFSSLIPTATASLIFLFHSLSAAPYLGSFPRFVLSVLGAWTVSSPADPADVYGADAAGCYYGAQVPIELSSDPHSSQHSVRSNITCHHHSHCQPPVCSQQVARIDRWEIYVHAYILYITYYILGCFWKAWK